MVTFQPSQAATAASAYNEAFMAGAQKFEILILGIAVSLSASYAAKIVSARYSFESSDAKWLNDTVEKAGFQAAFTLSLYLVLVTQFLGKVLKVSGGVN